MAENVDPQSTTSNAPTCDSPRFHQRAKKLITQIGKARREGGTQDYGENDNWAVAVIRGSR